MVRVGSLEISPPVVNSSCAWASDYDQLRELFDCQFTGAVVTRTAMLNGFPEDETHTVRVFRSLYFSLNPPEVAFASENTSSINSYGYSPTPLLEYLNWIEKILDGASSSKPFIISVTASDPDSMSLIVSTIQARREKYPQIGIELNTSCPNIRGHPPAAYAPRTLSSLLSVLADAWVADPTLTIGLKLPPYVYAAQFSEMIETLRALCTLKPGSGVASSPVAYLACTNTLGNSLLFADQVEDRASVTAEFAVPTALGGLAGDALHPLALGNVRSFAHALASDGESGGLNDVVIFGIGGVTSAAAAERMRKAGAQVVGCATLLGKEGVRAFEIVSGTEEGVSDR
ncbi:DHO-dh domain-containing protein [Mycena kentingensis (nom. inval.)]|nr:DHO-dh domain-containing protein [Mycena kentingensis (nom. inval.)]